ncbi:MAG: tetratricopeptide repeat protein [Candidatus Electronema sp. V4]|uniref:tetratricopeptide repeat protein n=1 Tax=Candidatus Electronema sp. V4 TaxID=3454756 RepID=UPI00405548CF
MKGLSNTAAAACALLLLCQCASQDEVRRLNYQLRSMNQKVQTVESKTAEKIKEVESKTAEKQLKESASAANLLEEMSEEARQLREVNQENIERFNQYKSETEDKIASLYAAIEQMQSENGHLSKSNEDLVRSLELKIEQLTSGLQQASQDRVQQAAQKAREAELRAKEAAEKAAEARKKADLALRAASQGGKTAETSPEEVNGGPVAQLEPENRKVRVAPPAPVQQPPAEEEDDFAVSAQEAVPNPPAAEEKKEPAPADSGEDALFAKGMTSFKDKKYKEAYKFFEQHLSGQPDSKQAAKTLYLMGECLFNQGEYDLAILDYQKVISNYSGDTHSPAALLRQAMSFEKLTDKETAKIIYGKLAADYPDSREAKVARERMENLRQP